MTVGEYTEALDSEMLRGMRFLSAWGESGKTDDWVVVEEYTLISDSLAMQGLHELSYLAISVLATD